MKIKIKSEQEVDIKLPCFYKQIAISNLYFFASETEAYSIKLSGDCGIYSIPEMFVAAHMRDCINDGYLPADADDAREFISILKTNIALKCESILEKI